MGLNGDDELARVQSLRMRRKPAAAESARARADERLPRVNARIARIEERS